MDDTPHVMLAGEGALKFALENGFEKKNLLTADSEKKWREWLKTSEYKPIINVENHERTRVQDARARRRLADYRRRFICG